MSMYTFLESLPDKLPKQHPLHHLRVMIFPKYRRSYKQEDLWDVYGSDLYLRNTRFPVNYFRTALVLILAKFKYFSGSFNTLFNPISFYPRRIEKTTKLSFDIALGQPSYFHPCRTEQNSRLALEIDNNCKARLFEIIEQPRFPYYNDWVKTTPVHLPQNAALNRWSNWGYISPEVNDFIKNTSLAYINTETLDAIACNPWITMETAQKIMETGSSLYHQTYRAHYIANLFLNTAIPIDFFLSYPNHRNKWWYLAWRPDADPKKLQPLFNQDEPTVYPNSTAEDIVALFKKERSARVRIQLLQHPAMPHELILETFRKTKNEHIKISILRSYPLDAFTALAHAKEYPTDVHFNLLIQQYNKWYKPIVQWLCETAASPETFFITTNEQRKELIEKLDAYVQEASIQE